MLGVRQISDGGVEGVRQKENDQYKKYEGFLSN